MFKRQRIVCSKYEKHPKLNDQHICVQNMMYYGVNHWWCLVQVSSDIVFVAISVHHIMLFVRVELHYYPREFSIPTQQNYFPHKTCHVSWLHLSQPTCIPTWKLCSGTWKDGIESPLRYMNRAKHEDIYDIELSRYESYNKCVPQISLQKKCGSLSMVLFH